MMNEASKPSTIKPAERLSSVSEYYFSRKLKEVAAMNAAGKGVISLGIGSPVMPPSEETVTPAPEDTTPVVPDAPVVDDPVEDVLAVEVEPSSNAGLWVGVGVVALAAIVVVLAIMAARKKRKQ